MGQLHVDTCKRPRGRLGPCVRVSSGGTKDGPSPDQMGWVVMATEGVGGSHPPPQSSERPAAPGPGGAREGAQEQVGGPPRAHPISGRGPGLTLGSSCSHVALARTGGPGPGLAP